MARGRPAHPVALSQGEREQLEAIVRQKTSPQRDVLRANIALMADRGESTQGIADALGTSQQTVTKWRRQAALRGKDGLQEAHGPGAPGESPMPPAFNWWRLACEAAEPEGRATPTLDEIRNKPWNRGLSTG